MFSINNRHILTIHSPKPVISHNTRKVIRLLTIVSAIFIYTETIFAASNYYLESEIANTLKKTIKKEAFIWLDSKENHLTLALLEKSHIADNQGGIIILPDLGQHPDGNPVIHRLRLKLSRHGWDTLSIQMPLPSYLLSSEAYEETYKLSKQRIRAGIEFFKNDNINNIVLIGLGHSANFSIKFTAQLPEESTDIQALVIISAFDTDWMKSSQLLRMISMTTLDVYGQHDRKAVLQSAEKRLTSAQFSGKLKSKPRFLDLSNKIQKLAINKTGNLRYRQTIINAADEKYLDQEDSLIKTIRGWIGIYAAGTKIAIE